MAASSCRAMLTASWYVIVVMVLFSRGLGVEGLKVRGGGYFASCHWPSWPLTLGLAGSVRSKELARPSRTARSAAVSVALPRSGTLLGGVGRLVVRLSG